MFVYFIYQKMAISHKTKEGDSVDAVAGPSQNPNKNAKGEVVMNK